jgi:leucyl-tRNA synthetase
MICLNELQASNCTSREIFEPLLILLSPFAPHIAEELWEALGNTKSIYHASWPDFDSEYLKESIKNYPISINGKTRTQMDFPINATKEQIEQAVLSDEVVIKWLEGKQPKKFIWVPGRIVNIVI